MAGMAPENVKKETLLSLKRLRTDYIDLYLIHHPVSISVSHNDLLFHASLMQTLFMLRHIPVLGGKTA